jgi:hypothetical protein
MARTDINRYRGDTKDLVMRLTQNKEVFPLTDFGAKLSVSVDENPTAGTYVLQADAVVDVAGGTLTFPFPTDKVDLLGDHYYDVQLTDGAGKTNTIRKGKMVFAQDITK